MRLIKRTEEYVVDTEEQAIKVLQEFKDDAAKMDIYLAQVDILIKLRKQRVKL